MEGTSTLGRHRPVMRDEVLAALRPRPGGRYVDATLGECGFAEPLLEGSAPDGSLLAIDRDGDALALARERLARHAERVRFVHASFASLRDILETAGWGDGADGIIVDLGVSTEQLGNAARGFSFKRDGPLDMRMDRTQADTAADLLAQLPEAELARILWVYGEEPASRRIARHVVDRRHQRPLRSTAELRELVAAAGARGKPGRDVATRTFQALRVAVNAEIDELEELLADGWRLLRPGGRLAVLSYHSLEDRVVKRAFRLWSSPCTCPPELPVCACGLEPEVRRVTRRRMRPRAEEVAENPRARSAGLRVVERLGGRS